MSKFRIDRVNEEIKKAISNCIQNDLKNYKSMGLITVTRVETTQDFKNSKVYVSIYDKNKQSVFEFLKKSVGKMKRAVSQNVKIRFVPEIDLKLDDSIEYSFHIDEILKKTKSMEKDCE